MGGKRMENRAVRESVKEAVLLVDDHELIRLGFRALLETRDDTRPGLVVFEADTLAGGMQMYADHREQIAVVVLDLARPDAEGLGGLMAFRQRFPEAAIVVLSGVQSEIVMQHALALGALAYFPKSGDLADMTNFVQRCARQDLRLPRMEADAKVILASEGFDLTRPAANNPRLSHRQLEILRWLLEGRSNREISQLSSLSEGTVKNNVSMLLLAFDVRSRSQLISKLRPLMSGFRKTAESRVPDAIDLQVEREQVRLVYATIRTATVGDSLLAFLFGGAVYWISSNQLVFVWLALHVYNSLRYPIMGATSRMHAATTRSGCVTGPIPIAMNCVSTALSGAWRRSCCWIRA